MCQLKYFCGRFSLDIGVRSAFSFNVVIAIFSVIDGLFMFWQAERAQTAKVEIANPPDGLVYTQYEIPGLGEVLERSAEWFDDITKWLRIEGAIYCVICLVSLIAAAFGYFGYKKRNFQLLVIYELVFAVVLLVFISLLVIIIMNLPDTSPRVVIYFLVYPSITILTGAYMLIVVFAYTSQMRQYSPPSAVV